VLNHLMLQGRESLSSCLIDADATTYACAPSLPCDILAQGPCSPSLGSSQSLEPPKHRSAHHLGHLRNTPISSHQCQLHGGVARQLTELGDVLIHRHEAMFQIIKLLLL
jgi:hypothetical protein